MKIPDKLQELSRLHKRPLDRRALKLCEEAGEVAEAVLIYLGEKGKGVAFSDKKHAAVVEECIDTIIMSMDILTNIDMTDKTVLSALMDKKLDKWQKFINKQKT